MLQELTAMTSKTPVRLKYRISTRTTDHAAALAKTLGERDLLGSRSAVPPAVIHISACPFVPLSLQASVSRRLLSNHALEVSLPHELTEAAEAHAKLLADMEQRHAAEVEAHLATIAAREKEHEMARGALVAEHTAAAAEHSKTRELYGIGCYFVDFRGSA